MKCPYVHVGPQPSIVGVALGVKTEGKAKALRPMYTFLQNVHPMQITQES